MISFLGSLTGGKRVKGIIKKAHGGWRAGSGAKGPGTKEIVGLNELHLLKEDRKNGQYRCSSGRHITNYFWGGEKPTGGIIGVNEQRVGRVMSKI